MGGRRGLSQTDIKSQTFKGEWVEVTDRKTGLTKLIRKRIKQKRK